MTFKSDRK